VVSSRWNREYLLNARTREAVQDHVRQLGGFLCCATPRGEVHFHKDEQGLPYIDLAKSRHEATRMLMQLVEATDSNDEESVKVRSSFMQTVRGNYEGYTKREVLRAKEACQVQALLENPSEKDYQGMI